MSLNGVCLLAISVRFVVFVACSIASKIITDRLCVIGRRLFDAGQTTRLHAAWRPGQWQTLTDSLKTNCSDVSGIIASAPRVERDSPIVRHASSSFYARQHICYSAYMLWQFRLSVCLSVRLSVCLSHGWISQKRLKLGSRNYHHTVAPSL